MAFNYAVQHVSRYVENAARTVAKHAPTYGVVNAARAISAAHHIGMTKAPQTYDSVRRALGK